MHLAFVVPKLGGSGGYQVLLQRARDLAKLGHQLEIVISEKLPPAFQEGVDLGGGVFAFSIQDRAEKSITYDWVIATWWETAFDLLRLRSHHWGYYVQGFEFDFYVRDQQWWRPFVESTYRDSHLHFWCVSEALKSQLTPLCKNPLGVVRNGVSLQECRTAVARLPESKKRMRVLVEGPGGLAFKNVRLALSVLESYRDQVEVVLLSSDGQPFSEFKPDHFFSQLAPKQVFELMKSCDCILKLSETESFALPVAEMFACGGTAVVHRFAGCEEYMRDEKNALLVDLREKGSVHRAMERLLDEPGLLERLKAGARQTAEGLGWAENPSTWLSVLESPNKSITQSPDAQWGRDALPELKRQEQAFRELKKILIHADYLTTRVEELEKAFRWRLGPVRIGVKKQIYF